MTRKYGMPTDRGGRLKRISLLGAAALAVAQVLAVVPAHAQNAEPAATTEPAAAEAPRDIVAQSLPLRTALHHDSSLEAPFDRLVALYREAGRMAELIETYRSHVKTYPTDPNGAAVLVRLLEADGAADAPATAKSLAEAHPKSGYLQYLWYLSQRRTRRIDALQTLEQAIALAPSPRLKSAWTETLLTEAASGERQDLVDKYLGEMSAAATTADAKLEVARRMLALARHKQALTVLEEAATMNPAPEVGVQIQTTAVTVEIALDKSAEAAARLDRLLEKLAPDYWARPELVRRRMALITTEAERTAMVDAARKRFVDRPTDEQAAADLAQLLIGFERRREALTVLLEAGRKITSSERLEKATLELLDRLRDEPARRAYLAERTKAAPERIDLLALYIKALLAAGDRVEGRKQIARLVADAPADQREKTQIELARSLVRSALTADAAEVFEAVIKAAPNRFDLRRETAELYIKLGNRGRARELFAVELSDDVPVETVMDFVPFLIQNEMYVEARKALKKVIKPDDPDLDLRLLAADVERRLGNRNAAAAMLVAARSLADTSARYKAWIEASAALHEEDESLGKFVADEQVRLSEEQGAWTEARLERLIAFLEVAGREKAKVDILELTSGYIDDESIPATTRRTIRRHLVRILKTTKDNGGALVDQLQTLITELPDDADEYRARLAILHIKAEQHHLAEPLLNGVRVARIGDLQLLGELESAFGQFNQSQQVSAVLERLTTLEPTNKAHWEAWLYHSAMTGREDRLRDSLRRLQGGVEGIAIEDDVKELLRAAEIDSYGRSILSALSDGREGPLSEALALASSAERKSSTPQQSLWLYWNRAFILNRLNRTKERDEAIAELERVLKEIAQPPVVATAEPVAPSAAGKPKPKATGNQGVIPTIQIGGAYVPVGAVASLSATVGNTTPATSAMKPNDGSATGKLVSSFQVEVDDPLRLRFADGLSLSIDSAHELLRAPAHRLVSPARIDDRRGPLPPFRLGWAIDFPAGRSIESIHQLSPERLLIVDVAGMLTVADIVTGKVVWEAPNLMPRSSGEMTMTMTRTVRGVESSVNARVVAPAAQPIVDERQNIYFAGGGEVTRLSGADGSIVWRSSLSSHKSPAVVVAGAFRAPNPVFLNGDEVLAFDPETDTVAAIDCATGKLRWTYDIGGPDPQAAYRALHWMNTGASFDGRRIFVYGRRAAMIDVATRNVQWTIDADKAAKLPVKLDPQAQASSAPALPTYTRSYSRSRYMGNFGQIPYGGYSPSNPFATMGQGVRYIDFSRRTDPSLGANPRTPVDTTLVGPAAMWSTATTSGQPRCAILSENKLLLGAGSESSVMDTDFPIAGRRHNFVGTYVGRVGRRFCSLRGNELAVLDLDGGTRGAFKLNSITGGEYNARNQAVIDGPLAYVFGPQGIVCFNVLAKRRVFMSPWPEDALLDADDSRVPAGAETVDQGTHYLWSGVVVPDGLVSRNVSPAAVLAGRRLITAATPWRIVAIQGADEP